LILSEIGAGVRLESQVARVMVLVNEGRCPAHPPPRPARRESAPDGLRAFIDSNEAGAEDERSEPVPSDVTNVAMAGH
jgi:hypothetical protein